MGKKRSGELTLHTNHDIQVIKQRFLTFFGGGYRQKQKVTNFPSTFDIRTKLWIPNSEKNKYDAHMHIILQTILGSS